MINLELVAFSSQTHAEAPYFKCRRNKKHREICIFSIFLILLFISPYFQEMMLISLRSAPSLKMSRVHVSLSRYCRQNMDKSFHRIFFEMRNNFLKFSNQILRFLRAIFCLTLYLIDLLYTLMMPRWIC